MTIECWKPIPGFEGYEASDCGHVRSYFVHAGRDWRLVDKPQRILAAKLNTAGYRVVILRSNGKSHCKTVHRLVLLTFVGECPDGLEACHNDSNKLNNHLWNLRYGTHASNLKDLADAREMGFYDED